MHINWQEVFNISAGVGLFIQGVLILGLSKQIKATQTVVETLTRVLKFQRIIP